MSTNQPRRPAGTPAGGQWAPTAHSEPDIELTPVRRPVKDLRPGDMVDLEGDPYADESSEEERALKYELAEVLGMEQETPDGVRVDFDFDSVGFPTDHEVTVVGHQDQDDEDAP